MCGCNSMMYCQNFIDIIHKKKREEVFPLNKYIKNQTIIQAGDPFLSFSIIAEGSVAAAYDSSQTTRFFTLKKGDIVGIFEFGFKEYSFTYTALEDTQLISYPLANLADLPGLLEKQKDLSQFLLMSMVQNVSRVLSYYRLLCDQQDKLYQYIVTASDNYQKLCQLYKLPVKNLPNKDKLLPFSYQQEAPDFWLEDYYQALKAPVLEKNPMLSNPSLVMGLLIRCARDIHTIMYNCRDIQEYLEEISHILLNENYLDLFDLYTDLIFRAKNANKDIPVLEDRVKKMLAIVQSHPAIDKELAAVRVQEYEKNLKRDHSYEMASEESLSQIQEKLAHSLDIILEYADSTNAACIEFRKFIEQYKELSDKNSLDKDAEYIRKQLTRLFNIIYTETFQIALNDPTPPLVVKMFLNFGYVDMELAGIDNAAYLYSIAKNYQGDPANGVYTLYEWVSAIFRGDKQPSRNELSQDYIAYVHTLRAQNKIDAATAQSMQDDTLGKVMYELENMFPVVNKVTHGHFKTFCPVFIEGNVVKSLESTLITPYKLNEALDKILAVDFSAFYRSFLFTDEKVSLKETVDMDVKPDFILMPNVGCSGICWQEIEGMQRSTPGRMMLSAFHMENLEKTLVQMIGDFRWELCRRVQGMRWNDVTEHSLTSDYYDYVMFYSKNRDLSQEAKEKVKQALARARNSYKNMFITDYTNWVLSESKGTVKLNKIARQIFSTYCPFTEKICENLLTNGAFTESIQQYNIKKKQHLFHLSKVVQKYTAQGKPVPEAIENEIRLIDK